MEGHCIHPVVGVGDHCIHPEVGVGDHCIHLEVVEVEDHYIQTVAQVEGLDIWAGEVVGEDHHSQPVGAVGGVAAHCILLLDALVGGVGWRGTAWVALGVEVERWVCFPQP